MGEVRRLRRECERLSAAVSAGSGAAVREAVRGPQDEWGLVVEAAVLGNSDEDIVRLLVRAGGRAVSHQTVHAILAEAGARARKVFEAYFAGKGRVGAADEIFLGRAPLLLVVEPLSLLISGLRLASGRGAEDWEPLLAAMEELERCASDDGWGVTKAAEAAGLSRQADMFHGLYDARAWLGRFEKTAEARLAAEEKAWGAVRAAASVGQGRKHAEAVARQRHAVARRAANRGVAEWCRLSDLVKKVQGAFDYTTPEGTLNTAERASGMVAEVLAALEGTEDGRRLAKTLRRLERPAVFAFLRVLEEGLGGLRLEQVGPDRRQRLARLVAETVAWRRRDKDPVALLEAASTGSLADEVELAVVRVVDLAIRSSSAVECVNSRIRLVQVARKRLSEDFVYLLAVYHNMRKFGRGSVREGKTAARLAGIQLPTEDWITLLHLAIAEPAQASAEAA
jgi:hypothetical protein